MQFIGCAKAGPLAVTKVGSNPLAFALVTKTKGSPQTPNSENDDMDQKSVAKAATAILSMDDVTKAHYLALNEDGQVAFLEKSADVMKSEAHAAKKATDDAAAAAAAKAAGLSEREAAAEKRAQEAETRVATLEKRLDDSALTAEIEKTALSDDYKGFPGGSDKLMPALKTAFKLTGEDRTSMLDALKGQAAFARSTTQTLGGATPEHIEKTMPSTAKVKKAAQTRAETSGKTVEQEIFKMSKEPAWRADIEAMQNEEQAA